MNVGSGARDKESPPKEFSSQPRLTSDRNDNGLQQLISVRATQHHDLERYKPHGINRHFSAQSCQSSIQHRDNSMTIQPRDVSAPYGTQRVTEKRQGISKAPSRDYRTECSDVDFSNIQRGQIIQAPSFELCADPNTLGKIQTRYGEICGKLRFGMVVGKNAETRRIRVVWFYSSGKRGPGHLTGKQRETVFALVPEGEDFKCLDSNNVEHLCNLPGLKILKVPTSFKYKPILGAYCNVAITHDIMAHKVMKLMDRLTEPMMEWFDDFYLPCVQQDIKGNLGREKYFDMIYRIYNAEADEKKRKADRELRFRPANAPPAQYPNTTLGKRKHNDSIDGLTLLVENGLPDQKRQNKKHKPRGASSVATASRAQHRGKPSDRHNATGTRNHNRNRSLPGNSRQRPPPVTLLQRLEVATGNRYAPTEIEYGRDETDFFR